MNIKTLMFQMLMQPSVECLSLTVEEVMHIRSVLTKAELECIVMQPELYNQLANRKVSTEIHEFTNNLIFFIILLER